MWKDGGEARKTRDNHQRLPLLTTPFDPPKSSEIAVKVIDKAGMETTWVINRGKEQ